MPLRVSSRCAVASIPNQPCLAQQEPERILCSLRLSCQRHTFDRPRSRSSCCLLSLQTYDDGHQRRSVQILRGKCQVHLARPALRHCISAPAEQLMLAACQALYMYGSLRTVADDPSERSGPWTTLLPPHNQRHSSGLGTCRLRAVNRFTALTTDA